METENFKRAKKIEIQLEAENTKLKQLISLKENAGNVSIRTSEAGRSDFLLPFTKTEKEIIFQNLILNLKHKIRVLEREFESL